jgi:hypothetical protein
MMGSDSHNDFWPPKGGPVAPALIGDPTPATVLLEYDCIVMAYFTTRPTGELLYWHWCDENAARSVCRYIAAEIEPSMGESLANGTLEVRAALDRPRVWVVDIDAQEWSILRAWDERFADIPEDVLPVVGARFQIVTRN